MVHSGTNHSLLTIYGDECYHSFQVQKYLSNTQLARQGVKYMHVFISSGPTLISAMF